MLEETSAIVYVTVLLEWTVVAVRMRIVATGGLELFPETADLTRFAPKEDVNRLHFAY